MGNTLGMNLVDVSAKLVASRQTNKGDDISNQFVIPGSTNLLNVRAQMNPGSNSYSLSLSLSLSLCSLRLSPSVSYSLGFLKIKLQVFERFISPIYKLKIAYLTSRVLGFRVHEFRFRVHITYRLKVAYKTCNMSPADKKNQAAKS